MSKRFIALFCCLLIITLPFTIAAETTTTEAQKIDEQDTGESIIVYVKAQEPAVLKSNLIEDDDVEVYAFLSGYTLGSIASTAGKVSQLQNEPFYAQPEIKQVKVRPLDTDTENLIRNIKYLRPLKYSMGQLGLGGTELESQAVGALESINMPGSDKLTSYSAGDLGTVLIRLKQVPVEKEVPEEITLNLNAEVTFENAERLFNMIQQDLVIPEDKDEAAWKEKNAQDYGFFSGRGFIRATNIGDNEASFVVYETEGYKEQATGWFTSIIVAIKQFIQTRSLSLKVGETSDYLRFSEMNFVPEKAFRIKLNAIRDPQTVKARASVSINGMTQNAILYEGMPLFSGSSYKVKSIATRDVAGGKKREDLMIQGPMGTFTATKTYVPKEQQMLLSAKYSGNNLVIPPFQISKLGETLNKYFAGAKISTPIADTTKKYKNIKIEAFGATIVNTGISIPTGVVIPGLDMTRSGFELKKDMTLAQALEGMLPAEYTYEESDGKIEIKATKEAEGKDVCIGRVTVLTSEKDVTDGAMENIICTAINEYQELMKDYGNELSKNGISYRDEANYRIGRLYWNLYNIMPPEDQLSAAEAGVSYLKKAVTNPTVMTSTDAQEVLNDLIARIDQSAEHAPIFFEDNGREVAVTLNEVIPTPKSEMPNSVIEVNGEKRTFDIGDTVTYTNQYAWKVKRMTSTAVTIEKVATTNTQIMSEQEDLRLNVPKKIDSGTASKTVTVKEINLHKEVYISVIPGTGKPLTSQGNFTIHIPIEKRLIPLSPETIDEQLNQTQRWIDELDKITSKLESVVKIWNTVCLATFAFLTIKNSFFLGLSRSQSRKDVVYGVDGASGWSAYCKANSVPGKYSYDDCIRDNEDKIGKQIDETQSARDKVDQEMKDYKNQQWYRELTAEYKQLDKYGSYVGEDAFFSYDALRNYRYSQLLQQTNSYSTLQGQDKGYNLKEDIDKSLVEYKKTSTNMQKAYNEAVEAMQNYKGLSKSDEQQVFNDIYRQKLQESKQSVISSDDFRLLQKTAIIVPLLRKDEKGQAYLNAPAGKTTLQPATVDDYEKMLESYALTAEDKAAVSNEIALMEKKYGAKANKGAPLSSSLGNIYVDKNSGKLYASTATYDLGQLNTKYKVKAVERYPDGKPYCVPIGSGNYVKVLDFFNDGSPKTVQEWNIGPDGLICTGDDIPLKHESLLNLPENEPEQRALRSKAARVGTLTEGQLVNIGGEEFRAETSAARTDKQASGASCYDVMDPDDCSTLFGVCDPVMCPVSRFNLGGTYQVDDVVQSGMIGSLVLGLNNFNVKEPVPICLTGILAGLKNIQSVLQGYVQCLKEAQTTGKSVGICDQIRSIFICDIVYREILSLFKAKGGILTWMAKKVFGEGGGEYLNFQSSLQNMQSSVSFFTQQYATTAFAAYRGRTTEEIGKTICSLAIYGKLPKLGEFVDQLTTPESPAQFTATLTVTPYSETARIKKESYNIFYHIYAGENSKADYSVFLRNRAGDAYYATGKCTGRSGTIAAGGISSQSLDCIADSGFDEVCVTINGVTHCGFGKVTSTFALNYMNDLIVEDEASKQIKSEEDCVPDNQRYSAPAYGLIPGATSFGSTGIIRVCSVQNPGQGTTPENWKVIGTCGKDLQGHNLGSCWIDMRTVTIKDVEKMESTQRALQEAGLNATKIAQGIATMDKEEAEAELASLNSQMPGTGVAQKLYLLHAYEALEENSLSLAVAAESKYKAAGLYNELSNSALPPLWGTFGTALPAAETKAAKEPEKLTEKEAKAIEDECATCDSWLGLCSVTDCHGISTNCVFTRDLPSGIVSASPWVANIISDNECHACSMATSCSYFSNDQTQCERIECTRQAKLECTWGKIFDKYECIPQEVAEVGTEVELGNIKTIPKIDRVRCEAGSGCKLELSVIEKLKESADALEGGETLRIVSAYRTAEQQRALFIKYLTYSLNPAAEKANEACPTSLAQKIVTENQGKTFDLNQIISSQQVQNLDAYKDCPHVKGTAIDVYLCDNTKTGTKQQGDACPKILGYENSERLQEVMCKIGWVSFNPERWHYEYGSIDWEKTKKKDVYECIFGSGTREHVVSPVEE